MQNSVVILGAAESGVGAALLAQAKGHTVFVSDRGPIQPDYKLKLTQAGIEFEENQHTLAKVLAADEVIKSPGIPEKAPVVQALREQKIPIISEIEFAGRYTAGHFDLPVMRTTITVDGTVVVKDGAVQDVFG